MRPLERCRHNADTFVRSLHDPRRALATPSEGVAVGHLRHVATDARAGKPWGLSTFEETASVAEAKWRRSPAATPRDSGAAAIGVASTGASPGPTPAPNSPASTFPGREPAAPKDGKVRRAGTLITGFASPGATPCLVARDACTRSRGGRRCRRARTCALR
jgi:hypothetical protein